MQRRLYFEWRLQRQREVAGARVRCAHLGLVVQSTAGAKGVGGASKGAAVRRGWWWHLVRFRHAPAGAGDIEDTPKTTTGPSKGTRAAARRADRARAITAAAAAAPPGPVAPLTLVFLTGPVGLDERRLPGIGHHHAHGPQRLELVGGRRAGRRARRAAVVLEVGGAADAAAAVVAAGADDRHGAARLRAGEGGGLHILDAGSV
jgi:hypothetical protein